MSDFQSNRPYTLFYYSSSRLLPRTMPEEEVFQFWCLIYGEKIPFAVDASFKWNVFQLTEAIQQKRSVLRDRDITELVLLKVSLSY
jgi:hypothetical protein